MSAPWQEEEEIITKANCKPLCSLSYRPPMAARRAEDVPQMLHVTLPRGAAWISGLYEVVDGEEANAMPIWKATDQDLWVYSMSAGKWGVGGLAEFDAAFQTGAAFVFCDRPHGGRMPHESTGEWLHCRPCWTSDAGIAVEKWTEVITVPLRKASPSQRYGMQTLVVQTSADLDEEARVVSPDPENGATESAGLVLHLHAISHGSLLAKWNADAEAAGRFCDVIPADSVILRVGSIMNPWRMQEALLTQMCAEVSFKRPIRRRAARRGAGVPTDAVEAAGNSGTAASAPSGTAASGVMAGGTAMVTMAGGAATGNGASRAGEDAVDADASAASVSVIATDAAINGNAVSARAGASNPTASDRAQSPAVEAAPEAMDAVKEDAGMSPRVSWSPTSSTNSPGSVASECFE